MGIFFFCFLIKYFVEIVEEFVEEVGIRFYCMYEYVRRR